MIGIFPLIAGLCLWLATQYHVLGIVLTAIGGALLLVQVIFMWTAIVIARRLHRKVRISLW